MLVDYKIYNIYILKNIFFAIIFWNGYKMYPTIYISMICCVTKTIFFFSAKNTSAQHDSAS